MAMNKVSQSVRYAGIELLGQLKMPHVESSVLAKVNLVSDLEDSNICSKTASILSASELCYCKYGNWSKRNKENINGTNYCQF